VGTVDDNRFFKFLWRFNALAIAAVVLLAGAILSFEVIRNVFQSKNGGYEVVNVDETDTSIEEVTTVSVGEGVSGYAHFRVNLSSEQTYDHGYSSKSTQHTTINTGFFDPLTGDTTWVFNTNEHLITQSDTLYKPQPAGIDAPLVTSGQLLSVVSKDTTGDKRLSNSDLKDVWGIGPTGSEPKLILSGITGNLSVSPLGYGRSAVFYRDEEGLKSTVYNPQTKTTGTIHKIQSP
jgi:hypothetical protein